MSNPDDYPGDECFPFGPVEGNGFPDNPIFEKLPQFDYPINIPTVFPMPGPTLLEVLKALRDTFAATNGRIPTQFLDALISQYDFTITMETTSTVTEEDVDAEANKVPEDEPYEEYGFGD